MEAFKHITIECRHCGKIWMPVTMEDVRKATSGNCPKSLNGRGSMKRHSVFGRFRKGGE